MKVRTKYIKEKEVAELSSRSLSSLRNDRSQGKGINYHKVGRSIYYDIEDVYNYMESCKIYVNGTAKANKDSNKS